MAYIGSPWGMGEWEGLERESGSMGGRLARVLAGEEGPEARVRLMDALVELFNWWGMQEMDATPMEQPEWLMAEAVPGLVGLSRGAGPLRYGAFQLLTVALRLHDCASDVADALKAAWAAAPETLADSLYQEPPDNGLVSAVVQCIDYVANALPLAPGALRWALPEPKAVLAALAASFRFIGCHVWWLEWMIYREDLFPLEVVLGDEELCREVAAYVAWGEDSSFYADLLWKLLSAVGPGDARLCDFLRKGAAGACVRAARQGAAWSRGSLPHGLARLLAEGSVGRETRALRAQLFRDAGLGEALARRRSSRPSPSQEEEALEKSYAAALRLPTTRLAPAPTDIHF